MDVSQSRGKRNRYWYKSKTAKKRVIAEALKLGGHHFYIRGQIQEPITHPEGLFRYFWVCFEIKDRKGRNSSSFIIPAASLSVYPLRSARE